MFKTNSTFVSQMLNGGGGTINTTKYHYYSRLMMERFMSTTLFKILLNFFYKSFDSRSSSA
jgi:hypothetical protein